MHYNIAVLLTCHNRKNKTTKAIESLLLSKKNYCKTSSNKISASFFVTDDGCTDGTIEKLISTFPFEEINVIKSDGNAYWAGGMRIAWERAIEKNTQNKWDFYLLINDDVIFLPDAFEDLFKTHNYSIDTYGKGGVYSGFICDTKDPSKIIYGAKDYKNIISKTHNLFPTGNPQECSMTNANILLVSHNVVNCIGILDKQYIHGGADWDYGLRARKANLPVLTTSGTCGISENDHDTNIQERNKVVGMTMSERKKFLNRPTREYHDASIFFRRYNIIKYMMLKIAYFLNLYFPKIYYFLNEKRPR